jgi:multicomponent Na+:H+ antiporter subunit D
MLHNHLTVLPILIPLTGAMIALILRQAHRLQAACALGIMLMSLAASAWLTAAVWQGGQPIVFQSGGWSPPFGITLVGDLLSSVFVLMSQLVLTTGVIYAMGSKDAVVKYPTFYPLFLMLATSLTGAMLTGDLFNMYVFAELLVISGTVLTAVSDDRYGTEAAYKYFYISLTASFFMLFAIGSLYVCYGTLNMADLAERISLDGGQPLLLPGIGFLMATFMIKSAVFPFHFWQPDFHTAAPTCVSAMLSSVVVKLGIYGFLRMTTLLFVSQAPVIRWILVVLGVAGVVFGGLSAVGTHNAKRMLAYSTLAQIGFILIGIGWGTPLAIAAAIVFAFNHSLVKAAMLMLAGYVASRAPVKSAALDIVTGVGKSIPAAGALFLIGSLSLAGIPPTNGFISKMMLFHSGIDAAEFGTLLLMGIGSLLTLVYTNRAFIRIWWQKPLGSNGAKSTGDRLLAPAILIVLILILGLWAEPLLQIARETSLWLNSPGLYIQAVLRG